MSLLPATRRAATVELDAMVRDLEPGPGGRLPIDGWVRRSGQVVNPGAVQAGEMMMHSRVAVEPRQTRRPVPASGGAEQLPDEPFLDQEPEVPVHGAEAHPGEPTADLPMHPLGVRVEVGALDHFQDEPAWIRQAKAAATEGLRT